MAVDRRRGVGRCSRLANNHADNHGGALAVIAGTVEMHHTVVTGNTSDSLVSVALVRGSGQAGVEPRFTDLLPNPRGVPYGAPPPSRPTRARATSTSASTSTFRRRIDDRRQPVG